MRDKSVDAREDKIKDMEEHDGGNVGGDVDRNVGKDFGGV